MVEWQPLYPYRVANRLCRVQSRPCPDCKVKDKITSEYAKKYKFDVSVPLGIHKLDALCFLHCTYDLLLDVLIPIELLYNLQIGRIDQKTYNSMMKKFTIPVKPREEYVVIQI